jgi:hypothetical protein
MYNYLSTLFIFALIGFSNPSKFASAGQNLRPQVSHNFCGICTVEVLLYASVFFRSVPQSLQAKYKYLHEYESRRWCLINRLPPDLLRLFQSSMSLMASWVCAWSVKCTRCTSGGGGNKPPFSVWLLQYDFLFYPSPLSYVALWCTVLQLIPHRIFFKHIKHFKRSESPPVTFITYQDTSHADPRNKVLEFCLVNRHGSFLMCGFLCYSAKTAPLMRVTKEKQNIQILKFGQTLVFL